MPLRQVGVLSLLIGSTVLGEGLPPSRILDGAHATDLIEVEDGWVLASDRVSGPMEWTGHLAHLDHAGNVLAEMQAVAGMVPRVAFSGGACAVAFNDPARNLSALRLIDGDIKSASTTIQLGGSSTYGTAVTWHPSRREWAVAVSTYGEDGITVRLQRYSERDLSPLGSVELGTVPLPHYSPSGVFHLFPSGRGYRMVIYPALAVVEWDTETVRTWPGLDPSPTSLGSVRPEGSALRIAYDEPGRRPQGRYERDTVSKVWLVRVERGEVTERVMVAQSPPGHTVAGVALYPTSTGHEVLWNEREPSSGGLVTRRASIVGGKVAATGQVTVFDVRHWALRSGQIGISGSVGAEASPGVLQSK